MQYARRKLRGESHNIKNSGGYEPEWERIKSGLLFKLQLGDGSAKASWEGEGIFRAQSASNTPHVTLAQT